MINGVLVNVIPGMEGILNYREVVPNRDLNEVAREIEEKVEAAKSQMLDKEIFVTSDMVDNAIKNGTPIPESATTIDTLESIDLDNYDVLNNYLSNVGAVLSTRKVLDLLGIKTSPNTPVITLLKLNQALQSIMPKVTREILTIFHNSIKTGNPENVDIYFALTNTIEKELRDLPNYNFEAYNQFLEDNGRPKLSLSEFDDIIDNKVDEISKKLYACRYSAGVLMVSYGVPEAKEQIKEIFNSYGINVDHVIDSLDDEQYICYPNIFIQAVGNQIGTNDEYRDIYTQNQVEIGNRINVVMSELAEKNSFTKLNQANNMQANVFATVNIEELLSLTLMSLAHRLFEVESVDELSNEDKAILDLIEKTTHEALDSLMVEAEGVELDNVHLKLASGPSHLVNKISLDQKFVRTLDGRYQTFCSCVGQNIGSTISNLINELEKEIAEAQARANNQ